MQSVIITICCVMWTVNGHLWSQQNKGIIEALLYSHPIQRPPYFYDHTTEMKQPTSGQHVTWNKRCDKRRHNYVEFVYFSVACKICCFKGRYFAKGLWHPAYLFYLFNPDHDAVLYGGEWVGGVGARLLFGRGLYRGKIEAFTRLQDDLIIQTLLRTWNKDVK